MKIHHIICDFAKTENTIKITNTETIKFIQKVIRIKNNETISIGNGIDVKYFCKITESNNYSPSFLEFNIEKEFKNNNENETELCLSIIKNDNFTKSVEKATELGIKIITPIISQNTIKQNLNIERLKMVAKESTEQSEQITIPKINEIKNLKDYVNNLNSINKKIYVCDKDGKVVDLKKNDLQKNCAIFIGPEGGWTQDEMDFFKSLNIEIIKISENILRAETAVAIASYLVQQ